MGKKANVQDNISSKISLVVRSGKYRIGYKLAMKALRNGQSKVVIIANNCPAIRKTQLEYMAILANSDVIHFDGNNVELGTVAGRLHRVCVMSVSDPGDSDILASVGK